MFSRSSVSRRARWAVCFAGLAAPLARAPFAHAMERVTLRSGITVDCTRHETVGDHIRLYTGRSRAYQEVSFLQIVSIDYLPDSLSHIDRAQPAPKPIVLPQPIVLAAAKAPTVPAQPKPIASPAVPAPAVTSSAAKPPAVSAPGTAALPRAAALPAFSGALTTLQPQFPELEVHDLLQRAGSTYNIDAELLASIIHAESGYNARATSRGGARGLMQIMPSTGRLYGAGDLFRPEDNISAGTAFLDALLKRYNDNLALALAAYNAGPAAVERYHGVPPFLQTRRYVSRVMDEFYRRKLALGAKPSHPATTASNTFYAPPPQQPAKATPINFAPTPLFAAPTIAAASRRYEPTRRSRRGHESASSRSIHRAWSGQRSFPRSRAHSSYQGF